MAPLIGQPMGSTRLKSRRLPCRGSQGAFVEKFSLRRSKLTPILLVRLRARGTCTTPLGLCTRSISVDLEPRLMFLCCVQLFFPSLIRPFRVESSLARSSCSVDVDLHGLGAFPGIGGSSPAILWVHIPVLAYRRGETVQRLALRLG